MDPAEIIRIKELLPTSLGSDEVKEQVAADILRRSIFSARMEDLRHLAVIRDVCAGVVAGEINQATARERLLASLARMGHSPLDGGGIANPASIRRLDLIIDTQRQMAASVANMAAETPATLEEWPAHELVRFVGRSMPRADWPQRCTGWGRLLIPVWYEHYAGYGYEHQGDSSGLCQYVPQSHFPYHFGHGR